MKKYFKIISVLTTVLSLSVTAPYVTYATESKANSNTSKEEVKKDLNGFNMEYFEKVLSTHIGNFEKFTNTDKSLKKRVSLWFKDKEGKDLTVSMVNDGDKFNLTFNPVMNQNLAKT